MFDPAQYQLLDFGQGRKLERFAGLLVDRPAPAAEGYSIRDPELWERATARFDLRAEASGPERGVWQWLEGRDLSQESHFAAHAVGLLELGWTSFGHVGLFPEQAPNWDWLAETIRQTGWQVRVLNLFAHTGGSTLAVAAADAEVTHVDASRSSVAWARRNAEWSVLGNAPIRWIVEDAIKYAARELRRGRRYEGIILDPPSYGHGPQGELWRIDEQLPELMGLCGQLLSEYPVFFLLTCHSPTWPTERLEQIVRETLSPTAMSIVSGPLAIESVDGRSLDCGSYVRARL